MSTPSVSEVLESVADVASERELADVRRSLLQTVSELLRTQSVSFCARAPGDLACTGSPLRLRLTTELLEQLAHGAIPTVEVDGDHSIRLYPVSDDEILAVGMRADTNVADNDRVVQALLRLYANFVELIAASEQDRLTGLLNRRSFDAQLARVAEASAKLPVPARPDEPGALHYWLALFDVDHFKSINDRFGHLFGDEVLLLLSRQLRQCFRGEDRCFRYGGEEFAVILAPTNANGAANAMERLRKVVQDYRFPQVGRVTISVGCAPMIGGLRAMDVVDRADRALYEAKKGGRNRVVMASVPATTDAQRDDVAFGDVELF